MNKIICAFVILESLNAFILRYLAEAYPASGVITLILAGSGGFALRTIILSDTAWAQFSLWYSLSGLALGFVFALIDGFRWELFGGYLVSWAIIGVPIIFLVTWIGNMIGKLWLAHIARKTADTKNGT